MKEVSFSGEDAEKSAKEFAEKKKHAGSEKVRPLRTYRADVQELIQKKHLTRTRVAVAEEERRRAIGESSVWEGNAPRSVVPGVLAGVFLLVGVSLLFFDLVEKSVPILGLSTPTPTFRIPGEDYRTIILSQLTREEMQRALTQLVRNEKMPQGVHKRTVFTLRGKGAQTLLSTQSLFSALDVRPPDIFLRSISNTFDSGLMSTGEVKGYLVLETTFYDNTVIGLSEWERTLLKDLSLFLDPLRAELNQSQEGTWRTQTSESKSLRIFETTEGRVALVYGWVNRKTLIIAGSIQAYGELYRLLENA